VTIRMWGEQVGKIVGWLDESMGSSGPSSSSTSLQSTLRRGGWYPGV